MKRKRILLVAGLVIAGPLPWIGCSVPEREAVRSSDEALARVESR